MGARRFILLTALCSAALLGSAAPAFAHAAYEASEPANGATVSSPPSRVIAEFTEPVVQGSTLTVVDPCGEQVDNGDSLVATDRITVTMSASRAGVYSVTFDVVSAVDGHNTGGTFTFTSSGGDPCPGEEPVAEQPQQPSGGGGGDTGSDSSGPVYGGNGGGSATTASSNVSSPSRSGGGKAAGAATQQRNKEAPTGGNRAKAGRDRAHSSGAEMAASTAAEEQAPSVWEGIPLGALIAALTLSGLIGAAGGKIYAGIMGWRA